MQQAEDRACTTLNRTCVYQSQAAEICVQSIWEELYKDSASEAL
jgi:hypothetical protein